jgi:SSS family solute:Na+ symporter
LGLLVFLLEWFHTNEKLFYWLHEKLPFMGKLWTAWQNYNIPFMMMAFYLFTICSVILVIGSLWKEHRHTEESTRLVWSNPMSSFSFPGWKGLGNYKFLAGLLFVLMAMLYAIFA